MTFKNLRLFSVVVIASWSVKATEDYGNFSTEHRKIRLQDRTLRYACEHDRVKNRKHLTIYSVFSHI